MMGIHLLAHSLQLMLPIHSAEKALVLGILNNPKDYSRREVYAQWLEENWRGDEADAERVAIKALLEVGSQSYSSFSHSSGIVRSGQISSGSGYAAGGSTYGRNQSSKQVNP